MFDMFDMFNVLEVPGVTIFFFITVEKNHVWVQRNQHFVDLAELLRSHFDFRVS
jgi:hypothetical protein